MMTVNEVNKITGVSIRTLQYYDKIGLLKPVDHTEYGYRLYDDTSLERLQQILLFKELEFSLNEIKGILDSPNYDREKALEQQIELLTLRKAHLENLIHYAREIREKGEFQMNFSAFDKEKIDEYSKQAKEQWGNTSEYADFEKKSKDRTDDEQTKIADGLMKVFEEFGQMKTCDPSDEKVHNQVKKLQNYICEHYYKCSDEVLAGLGQMYVADNRFTNNIDNAGGKGTALFVSRAIEMYINK